MKQAMIFILVSLIALYACSTPITSDPTSTPKPTWTPWPMAKFSMCTFFEGEIVKGSFSFRDPNTDELVYTRLTFGPECLVDSINPGEYILHVHICDPEHKCGPPAGCCYLTSYGHPVVLKADEMFEMDFEFYQTDFIETYPNWSE